MKRTLIIASLTLASLLLANCASSANMQASGDNKAASADQASAPRQRYSLIETQAKPGMASAFIEFAKKETIPALQKAGIKQLGYYTTAVFGEGGGFVSVRPIENLAEFDEPNLIVKALGEAGAKAWEAKRAQLIAGTHTYLIESRPELGIQMKENEAQKLAFVLRSSVAPGRTADYENFIKNDGLPIIKKANPKGNSVFRVVLGGDTNEYHSVLFADSFADYEKFRTALRKEGYDNVAPKIAGIVMHRLSGVYRFLPELSLPQPAMAMKPGAK
jgi:hypothetical protein